jgi:hypothetical protein
MSYNSNTYAKAVGKTINSVEVGGSDAILGMTDGSTLTLKLDGDCCSYSVFHEPEQFDELIGATIQGIEERDSEREGQGDENSEETTWHMLCFITNRGHVTIDWRNESNGYYDGYVTPAYSNGPQNDS